MGNNLPDMPESTKHFTAAARAYLKLIQLTGSDELAVKAFALLPYIKTKEDGATLAEFFVTLGGLRDQFKDAVKREIGIAYHANAAKV